MHIVSLLNAQVRGSNRLKHRSGSTKFIFIGSGLTFCKNESRLVSGSPESNLKGSDSNLNSSGFVQVRFGSRIMAI